MGIAGLVTQLDARIAQRRNELAARAGGQKLVGYFCNYVPRELIVASGAIPLRLADGGSFDARSRGERYVRADTCPFCKGCLDLFAEDPVYKSVSVIVAATMCDQMRRLPEVILRRFGIPVLQIALPRTFRDVSTRELFRHEIRWLRDELERLTGITVTADALRSAMQGEAGKRNLLTAINDMRRAPVPRITETAILKLVTAANLLPAEEFIERVKAEIEKPESARAEIGSGIPRRIMLAGSIVAEHDTELIEMIESRAAIVADLLCTGVRTFQLGESRGREVERSASLDETLDDLADIYFDQPGCISRRPNSGYYELARKLKDQFRVEAVILKTLLYCDAYNFEARQFEKELELPLLHIDTDYGAANKEQVKTRIEAFLETL